MKKLFLQTFGWPLSPKHWTFWSEGDRAARGRGDGLSGACGGVQIALAGEFKGAIDQTSFTLYT